MKKNALITLIILPSILLTGCSKPKHECAIHLMQSVSQNRRELSVDALKNLIEGKHTFSLFIYQNGCNSCEKTAELMNHIQTRLEDDGKLYSTLQYQIKVTREIYKNLREKLPDVFVETEDEFSTPNFYMFNKGELTYRFNQNHIQNKNDFEGDYYKMFYASPILYFEDEALLEKYMSGETITSGDYQYSKPNNFLFFVYDISKVDSVSFFSNYIFEKAANQKEKQVIVADYCASESMKEYFKTIGYESENHDFVTWFEQGNKKEESNYLLDNSSSINLVNSYFDL